MGVLYGQRTARFAHFTVAIIVLPRGLFLMWWINLSPLHWFSKWSPNTRTSTKRKICRKHRCCPWECAGESEAVDFASFTKTWPFADVAEVDDYQLLLVWIGLSGHQRHVVSTVRRYMPHSSCHIRYSAWAIWGHGHLTWRWCELATENVRFDPVRLFLVGFS